VPEQEVVITYRGNRYPAYTGRKFRLVLDVPDGYKLKPDDVAPLLEQQLQRLRTEERKRATALASELTALPSLGELVAEALRTPVSPGNVPRGGVDVFAGLRDKSQSKTDFQPPVIARSLPTSVKKVAERAHLASQMPKATPKDLKKVSQYFSPIANWLGFYPTTPQQYLDAAKSAVREGINLYDINKWMEGQGLSAATRAYILKEVSPIVDLETTGNLATKIYREGSFFLWRLSQFVGAIPRFVGQMIHDVAVVNSEYSGPNTWLREAVENTLGVRGVKPTQSEFNQAEKRLKDVAKGLSQDIRRLLPHKGWTKDMEEWYRRDSIVGPAVTLAILLDGVSLALRGTGQAVGAAAERTLRQAIEQLRKQPVKVGTPEHVQAELVARAIVNVIRERLSQIEKRDVSASEVLERIRGKSESEVARMLHPTAKTVAEGLEKAGYSVGLLTRFVNPLEWMRMTEEQFVSAMEKTFGISRDVWERYWQEASAARQRAQWAQEMKAKATGGTPPPTEQPSSGKTWEMEPPKPLPAPERPATAESKAGPQPPVAPEPQPQTPKPQTPETLRIEEPAKTGVETKPTEKIVAETQQPIPAEEYIPKRMDLGPEQLGTENLSYTAKHTQVRTQWAVVELDDLKVSHNPLTWHENPEYPQVLQPRDRSAAAMQQQVKEIAQNLVPEKLGDSASTSSGAPIVGEDGIVESGNGRTLALLLAYQYNPSAAEKYRRWLLENAERFGINPLVVQQLRRPVLVRIRPVERELGARASLVLEMGLSDVAQFSPVDRAMADARIIEKHINLFNPDFDLDAKENKRFVDAVLKDMPTSEVSQLLLSGGELSLTGINRLYSALLAYGYGSPALLGKLESPDLEVQRLAKGVAAAAADMAALRSGLSIIRHRNPEAADAYDIGNDIAQAVLWMEQLRKGGRNVRDFVEQGELFGGDYAIPRVVKLLLLAFDRMRSIKAVRVFLKTYADLASRAAALAAAPEESLSKQLLEQKRDLPDKEKLLLLALRQAEGGGTAGLFDDEEGVPDLPTAEELLSGITTEAAAQTEQKQRKATATSEEGVSVDVRVPGVSRFGSAESAERAGGESSAEPEEPSGVPAGREPVASAPAGGVAGTVESGGGGVGTAESAERPVVGAGESGDGGAPGTPAMEGRRGTASAGGGQVPAEHEQVAGQIEQGAGRDAGGLSEVGTTGGEGEPTAEHGRGRAGVVPSESGAVRADAEDLDEQRRREILEQDIASLGYDPRLYTAYSPRFTASLVPHPRQVLLPASLAGIEPDPITVEVPDILKRMQLDGVISDAQFDAVMLMLNAFENNHGFVLADDVGLGKTREIGAYLYSLFGLGKINRALVTTFSGTNVADMISVLQETFSRYDRGVSIIDLRQLRSDTTGGLKDFPIADRAIYVVDALGKFKDAVWTITGMGRESVKVPIDVWVSDEAHTTRGTAESVKNQAWRAMHAHMFMNENYRIVYSTATPAQSPTELREFYALRLWTLDPNSWHSFIGMLQADLISTTTWENLQEQAHSAASMTWQEIARERGSKTKEQRRGDDTTVERRVLKYDEMEQLMRELYASNRYTSRDLARGGVTFEVRDVPLTAEEENLIDKLAETIRLAVYWHYIGRRIDVRSHRPFPWAHAQFLMKRVYQGLRLKKILPEIQRLVSEGKQVVLYVESVTPTWGQSGSAKAILDSINTEQWTRDDSGSYSFVREHTDVVIAKQELNERFSELLDIPAPIDVLESEFGEDRVANITGESSPSQRMRLIDEFQSGKRRIALLSSAGQAGISLHHDSAGTGQRVLLFLDIPWRSDSFRQILGRVDRTGQLTSPHVILVKSGLAGENKIIATVAARLASLGALSKAESEAVAGAESLAEYEIDPVIGGSAVRRLWSELDRAEKVFYMREDFASDFKRNGTIEPLGHITADYNRWALTVLSSLPARLQARHYERFMEIYEELAGVQRARASRHRGVIEEESQLTASVRLYTVRTEQNLRYGILSGRLLLPVRGTAPLIHLVSKVEDSGADTGFVTFRDVRSGAVVSGLRIGITALGRLMGLLSAEGEFNVEKAWLFLQVGRVVLTQSPDPAKPYVLRRTSTREGYERIRIDNALMSQRDVLMSAGARFDARLGYWYLNWNVLDFEEFVKRFPLQPYSEVKKWEEEQSARRGRKGGETPSSGAGKGVFYRDDVPPIPNIGQGVAGRGEHPQGIILRLGRWIRVGRTPKRAAGYYDPRTADVVIRRWGDIPTAVHELAHAIDDEFGILAEWAEPRKHSPFDEELFEFLPEASRKRGSLRDKRAEAFAHWMEAYVLNPDVAAGSAPQFYAHLQMMLPGDMWDAIETWAKEIRDWVYSPAGEKIRAQFVFDKPKPEHIPDTFRVHWVDQLVRIFIDDRWPAIKAWREAKRRRGLQPKPSEDFELLISLWAGRYGKFVEMLHHGVPADQQGQKRSVPFIEMVREFDTSSRQAFIQDAYDLFAFMGAERAIELMERKQAQAYNQFRKNIGLPDKETDAHDSSDIEQRLSQMSGDEAERFRNGWRRVQQGLELQARRITGWGGGILRDDDIAREHLETLKREEPDRYEKLRRIAGMYREISDHVLQYAVSSGRITQEQYDAIKASNRYYVDFHRVFGWEAPKVEVSRSGNVSRVSAITWEIQGSTRRIHNPLVSLMESIARAIAECDRNYALAQFVNALELERHIYEGEPTLLADIGRRVNGPTTNAILVFRKGEGQWWEFHPEVMRAFNAWQDAYASNGWNIFAKVWGAVARLAYEGITKHPRFLLGNVVRDMLERLVRSPFRPVRAKKWQRHWWQFFGGSHAGFMHLQREDYYAELEKVMDELVRDRRFWVLPIRVLKRLWRWYLRIAEASEEFGRLNEFASAQRYAEQTLGYSTWDAMLFAAFASRRYMDFRVAGSLVRVLNRLVPFTSASVRGLSMGVEALIGAGGGGGGKRGKGGDVGAGGDMPWHYRRWGVEGMVTDSHRAWSTWIRLLLFVGIPSILVYLWNNRDEETGREYREFPPYLRYMFWLVHTPFGWVSIWKPYDYGVIASIFEAAIDGDMDDWAKALSRVALPLDEGDLALGFAGIVGAIANYDFFRGRWIVPPIEERRALKDSRGRWARDVYAASPLAQAIGDELNVDPRKVDYLLRTQFGHTGAMLGEASRMAAGERTLWDFILWQFGTKRELTPYMAESVQEVLDKAAQTGRDSKVRGLRELIERWYRQRARGASTEELRPLLHRIIRMAGRQERRVSRPFRSKVRPPK